MLKCKDLGLAKHCLGINIIQDLKHHATKINQRNYLENILDMYNMRDCNLLTIH